MKQANTNVPQKRDINKLLHLRGEINLSTRSESIGKKKFSRKEKHRTQKDCLTEFSIRVEPSNQHKII